MALVGGIPKSIHPNSGIKGLDIVMSNLNRAIMEIDGRSEEGLIRACILVRIETEKGPLVTPVDLGNLRASFFIVSTKGEERDPLSVSGNFKSKPFRKAQYSVSKLRADHASAIGEAQSIVNYFKQPVVIMGYSASYAMFVHEMLGATFKRPLSGPKWFEFAIKTNKDKMIETIAKYVKIP